MIYEHLNISALSKNSNNSKNHNKIFNHKKKKDAKYIKAFDVVRKNAIVKIFR